MKRPKVSVIMACYNSATFLEEAIKSIMGQTFTDFEFIIVDDASTDGTSEIIRSYSTKDPRIVLRRLDINNGPANARNIAIDASRGKWIANLDSDDVALPNRLELQIAFAESNPDIVLLGAGCTEIDASGSSLKTFKYPLIHRQLVKRLERLGAFFPHSSCLYKTINLNRVGGFNTRFVRSQDTDLCLRLSEVGRIACLSQPLIKLRKHQASISNYGGGRPSLIYGTAARVCHFLRLMEAQDPSKLIDSNWFEFINWLTIQLQRRGVFEVALTKSELKRIWKSDKIQRPRIQRAVDFAKTVFSQQKYCLRIAQAKFFGSNLSAQLARKWIDVKNNSGLLPNSSLYE